jgi:hypothetical protein
MISISIVTWLLTHYRHSILIQFLAPTIVDRILVSKLLQTVLALLGEFVLETLLKSERLATELSIVTLEVKMRDSCK